MDASDRALILVTGCARSGTSLTTQVLQACGANLGPVDNLYEHEGVRERVVKPYLSALGADPLGQNPLPHTTGLNPVPNWAGKVERMLGDADCYKGAKIALLWPLWRAAFPKARWVLCWRDVGQIAASCLRVVSMRTYKTHEDWVEWALQYHARMKDIRRDCGDLSIDIWPQKAIKDPDEYRPVVEHCGLKWNRDAVEQVIEPGRWHG